MSDESANSSDEVAVDRVLDHLKLQWESDCENSARYAFRTRLMAPMATGILGLTLFVTIRGDAASVFGELSSPARQILVTAFLLAIVMGTSLVILALLRILLPPRSVAVQTLGVIPYLLYGFAAPVRWMIDKGLLRTIRVIQRLISGEVTVPNHVLDGAAPETPSSWLMNLDQPEVSLLPLHEMDRQFIDLRRAAIADLQARNELRRWVVAGAERWLGWGVAWYGLAMLVSLCPVLLSYTA